MNSNFVTLKVETDVADHDKIKEKYNVTAFPTLIVLDGNGNEVSRQAGAATNPKAFIAGMINLLKPENSAAYHEDKYKKDPSYAPKLMEFYFAKSMNKEGLDMLNNLFAQRSIEENFSAENVAFYKRNIGDIEHPIIQYMLDNRSKVDKVMGKGESLKYVQAMVNSRYYGMSKRAKTEKDIMDILAFGDKNKAYKTTLYKFMKESAADIAARNFVAAAESAVKFAKKCDTRNRADIESVLYIVACDGGWKVSDANKEAYGNFMDKLIGFEKDPQAKKSLEGKKKMVTDQPKGNSIPAMRMM